MAKSHKSPSAPSKGKTTTPAATAPIHPLNTLMDLRFLLGNPSSAWEG